jgi:hypothetical protein
MLLGGPRDITVDHNTVIQPRASGILMVEGPPVLGFVLSNNLFRHSAYGIIGADRGIGLDTIHAFFPAARIVNNVIADGDARRYPEGNLFPSFGEFRGQFVSYEGGDYRLNSRSRWRGAGTDGLDLGATFGPASPAAPSIPGPWLPDGDDRERR